MIVTEKEKRMIEVRQQLIKKHHDLIFSILDDLDEFTDEEKITISLESITASAGLMHRSANATSTKLVDPNGYTYSVIVLPNSISKVIQDIAEELQEDSEKIDYGTTYH